jgi:hypothetical protein
MDPIVAIDIDLVDETTCACDMSSSSTKKVGACICTDCKCHLRHRNREIVIPLPSLKIQYITYGVIISTFIFIGLYKLVMNG